MRFRPAAIGVMLCLLALSTTGCGIQLGSALTRSTGSSRVLPATFEASARLHPARTSGPYAGWSAISTFGSGQVAVLHSVSLGAGYRGVLSNDWRLELGSEVGFGEPVRVPYAGTGLYVGATPALLWRLPIGGERANNLVGIAPFGWALDLVATLRGGRWTRALADGGGGTWEAGAGLALRFTLMSDLVVADDQSWEAP